ncbi:hypothetical protein [Lacticaseibacillus saniviri]
MNHIVGIYHDGKPVLEIRKGGVPLWKSQGWTTGNTRIGQFTNLPISGISRGQSMPNGTVVFGNLTDSLAILEPSLSITQMKIAAKAKTICVDKDGKLAAIKSDNDFSYFADPNNLATKLGSYALGTDLLARSPTGQFMIFSRYYQVAVFFKSPTDINPIWLGGSTIGVSYYNGNFYLLKAQGTGGMLLIKYDINGAQLAQQSINSYSYSVSDHGDSNSVQAGYDAAGNIFVIRPLATGQVLVKVTTDAKEYHFEMSKISDLGDAELVLDNVGNAYVARYSGSINTSTYISKIEITKFKNDLTLEWATVVDGSAPSGLSITADNKLLYLRKGSNSVGLYQQISK